jgi:hypothetical protein
MKKYYKIKKINLTKLKSYLEKKPKKDDRSKGHTTSRTSK